MKKLLSVVLPICVAAFIFSNCTQQPQTTEKTQSDYLVAAYIWPSCHNDTMESGRLSRKVTHVSKDITNLNSHCGDMNWMMTRK